MHWQQTLIDIQKHQELAYLDSSNSLLARFTFQGHYSKARLIVVKSSCAARMDSLRGSFVTIAFNSQIVLHDWELPTANLGIIYSKLWAEIDKSIIKLPLASEL